MQGGTEAQATWLQKKVTEFPKGSNTLIVTHMPNMSRAFPESTANLADGEALVFGPNGVVARDQNRRMDETQMKLFACVLLLTGMAAAQKPLTLASQGSFFVGGEYEDHASAPGRGGALAPATSPSTRCTCSIRSP